MRLPESLLRTHFNSSLKRGAVIRYLMPDPDDPAIDEKHKYALLLNLDPQDKDCFLFLCTSRIEKKQAIRERMPDAFHDFQVGAYGWVLKPTLLDLRSPKRYSRQSLFQAVQAETLTFEGVLRAEDIAGIDSKLKVSKTIEKVTLKRIVSF